jgi:hypothetical protein
MKTVRFADELAAFIFVCSGVSVINRWSANSAEGASADPLNFRVADFYSVGCRFESCWDRH